MKKILIIAVIALGAMSCKKECNCTKYIVSQDDTTGKIVGQQVIENYSRDCNSAGSDVYSEDGITTKSVVSCNYTFNI